MKIAAATNLYTNFSAFLYIARLFIFALRARARRWFILSMRCARARSHLRDWLMHENDDEQALYLHARSVFCRRCRRWHESVGKHSTNVCMNKCIYRAVGFGNTCNNKLYKLNDWLELTLRYNKIIGNLPSLCLYLCQITRIYCCNSYFTP